MLADGKIKKKEKEKISISHGPHTLFTNQYYQVLLYNMVIRIWTMSIYEKGTALNNLTKEFMSYILFI